MASGWRANGERLARVAAQGGSLSLSLSLSLSRERAQLRERETGERLASGWGADGERTGRGCCVLASGWGRTARGWLWLGWQHLSQEAWERGSRAVDTMTRVMPEIIGRGKQFSVNCTYDFTNHLVRESSLVALPTLGCVDIKGLQNLCQFFLADLVFLRKGPSESAARLVWTQAQKSTPARSEAYYLVKLSLPGGGEEFYY